VRKAFEETLGDGTKRVLCDQGDSEIWEEAQAKFDKLTKDKAD